MLGKIVMLVRQALQSTAARINHEAVIKDVAQETDISTGYFLTLTLANLIALSGLITNSAPVIIGAMLISPLMGPILSFGFAFITGARTIWRRSLRKIGISVVLTVAVAAVAAFLSPLKEITPEILSRTRPNLYDLIIAFLSGSAGAAALCTKKNYLTVVPGVAIATAVIPPLSVAGFGAGSAHLSLFTGGFFLFFTNFVAITLATSLVFFIYGFRPRMITETDVSRLKHRFAFLGAVLIVISIPLVYTLHVSIREVRLRSEIHQLLRMELDREKQSRLTGFDYAKTKDGMIVVNAVVNAVEYLSEEEITRAEADMAASLREGVRLAVEQVKVQPGGLKPRPAAALVPAIAPPRPPSAVLSSSRESVLTVVRESTRRMEEIIAPSTIADFSVGFHDRSFTVSIAMKLRRDTPVSDEERLWLSRMLSSELDLPVDLTLETVPVVPVLVFRRGETDLTEEMKGVIRTVEDVFGKDPGSRCTVEAYAESGMAPAKQRALSRKRIAAVTDYLEAVCKVPKDRIRPVLHAAGVREPRIKVSVVPSRSASQGQPQPAGASAP